MQNINLVLSKTYICQGKVYEKGVTYQVDDATGKYLLSQKNERNIPYFRLTLESTPAHIAGEKAGKYVPVEDMADEAEPEQEAAVEVIAEEEESESESELEKDPENPQDLEPVLAEPHVEDGDEAEVEV